VLTVTIFALLTTPAFAGGTGGRYENHPLHATQLTRGQAIARLAKNYVGTPYVWAGSTPSGFDCSGFVMYLYARLGISVPHSSYAQWDIGRHVARNDMRPGDIVFFGTGHVGIWLGDGRFIHSPHTGDVVSIDSIRSGWYAETFSGAVRLPGLERYL
jgi:cell wall-associated NlpC family hydrolase